MVYFLDCISSSTGTMRSGEPFTIYRVFYRDKSKRAFFQNFYGNSPVMIGGECMTMDEAAGLLGPGMSFVLYSGPNNSAVMSFDVKEDD